MAERQHFFFHFGIIEKINNFYYIHNDDQEYPIVLGQKQMLKLAKTLEYAQTFGKIIQKRLKSKNESDIPAARQTHYSYSIALKKFSIVKLSLISRGTQVNLLVAEYHMPYQDPTKLTPVHGELQLCLTENLNGLFCFILLP